MPDSASMSANRAVFLSYAHEDAVAALRIADALRSADVEVWFDQSELRGGDAWDARIREQVETCALFLPVISAHTQARREGYFRLEWNLAHDRTHLMAGGTPFLLPVVIDDTRDRGALVPKSFLGVQWTRLPAGETPIAFVQRMQGLLGLSSSPKIPLRQELAEVRSSGSSVPEPPAKPGGVERRDASERLAAPYFVDALTEQTELPPAKAGTPPRPRRKWMSRRVVGVVAFAAALIAAGIFATVWNWGPAAGKFPTEWEGQLLSGPLVAFEPRVSPDGQTVAFLALVDRQTQVGVLKPASGDWTVLTRKQKGSVWCPAWSRDGTRLFFSRWTDGQDNVFSVPTLSGDERLVFKKGGFPQVLPDRSLLVSRINEARDHQLLRFWPESGQTKLLGAIGLRATIGAFFRAFPDGREAVFFGRPESDAAASPHLYTIDLETGRTRRLAPRLTISPATWTFPLAVSPDGEWVLFDHAIGNLHRIVAVPRDGTDGLRTLITLTNDVLFLDVGPDFSLYVDQVRQPPRLLRYSPSDQHSEEWRLPMSVGNYPLPLPDGRVLLTTKSGGKNRLAVLTPGAEPKPFIETEEETNIPVALLGRDRLLLMLGRAPTRVVAIASLATGQIVGRIAQLPVNRIEALAGSPDGRTIFYVADKMVWAVPSEGSEPRQLRAGDAVAVDPGGKYLIVQLLESDGVRLVRVPLAEGAEENIPVAGDDKLGDMRLSPSAVDAEGRILIRIWSPLSWFTPAGVLDPRTGYFAPLTGTFDVDMDYAAWTADGRVISVVNNLESNLWRFRPVQR